MIRDDCGHPQDRRQWHQAFGPAETGAEPTTRSEKNMATYECEKCGMKVNATCGHCDAPLENNTLDLPDGKQVQISECPNGHGKIKSPLCCGQDMSCSLA
jgi:hypothetical protein